MQNISQETNRFNASSGLSRVREDFSGWNSDYSHDRDNDEPIETEGK